MIPDSARVATVEEAAAVLRISRSAAYRAIATGEIPSLRVGRSVRVPVAGLRELLGEADGPAQQDEAQEAGAP